MTGDHHPEGALPQDVVDYSEMSDVAAAVAAAAAVLAADTTEVFSAAKAVDGLCEAAGPV